MATATMTEGGKRISLTEEEVRLISREVAQEVIAAVFSQSGLTLEHLIDLRRHAEAMRNDAQAIRTKMVARLVDVVLTAAAVGLGFRLFVG